MIVHGGMNYIYIYKTYINVLDHWIATHNWSPSHSWSVVKPLWKCRHAILRVSPCHFDSVVKPFWVGRQAILDVS